MDNFRIVKCFDITIKEKVVAHMKKTTGVLKGLLITVALLALSGCGEGKNNRQTTDSEQETTASCVEMEIETVQFEKDGAEYVKELHSDFEVIYPVNNKKILSKELICNNEQVLIGGSIRGKEGRYTEINRLKIPKLFENEEIKYIDYTLYNCPGEFNGITTGINGFQMESKAVRYAYDEQENAYISILKEFVCYKGGLKERVEIKAFQKVINAAMLRADLTYQDGTKETVYIGLECATEYNYKVINFYKLTVE